VSHLAARSAYRDLVDRLNRFPQGAPPSDRLYDILAMLFSEREAGLVAQLPIRPFTADLAARRWKVPEAEARRVLDELSSRAVLIDTESPGGVTTYVLPPPMAGFFEFSMMRLRGDVDQHILAELFYQYLNVEEAFIRDLFGAGETRLGRAFVDEDAVEPELSLHLLDYERASEVVKSSPTIGVGLCYCRHKMRHLGRACDAPVDNCMTFNSTAASLTRHGVARAVDAAEGLDLLQQARDRGLVQFGENARRRVAFICNCCGCCCEAMTAARRFGFLHPVHTTNFILEIDRRTCTGCQKCVERCPVEALGAVSANDPQKPRRKTARLDEAACLGCGVCVSACPEKGLRLVPRAERVITPVTSTHRVVVQAIERGLLPNLIFDNHALASHRAMAAILGVILRLPPIKQAMASRQMKSRYLDRLIERFS
jgi:formate hydrogenlyase subunit 6/NADH:ubiquinone oxidoreductase subunit I